MKDKDELTDIVVMEWTFSPPEYFGEPIQIERNDYEMTIDAGKVKARIDPKVYEQNQQMRDKLHNELNDRFIGVQLLSHKPYKLSTESVNENETPVVRN